MSLPWDRDVRQPLIAAWVLGAVCVHMVCAHRAEAAGVLNVCIDQDNPTAAIDLRVARAVAKTQGSEVKEVAFEGYGKGDDGFPPSRFAKMAESDCQLIMGFPVDISNPNLPANVQATLPYASTGFVLVSRGNSKSVALGDLPNGSEVGIAQLDTYAGLLYGIHRNIVMHVYEKDSMMLADLAAKRIVAGIAWQPSIESYETSHPKHQSINLSVLPERHMLWNLVALYAPQSRDAANLFDKGLSELQSKGGLQPLIAPYQQAAVAATQPTAAMRPGTIQPRAIQLGAIQPEAIQSGSLQTGDTRWPAAHLQSAVAWNTDSGRWVQVSDTGKAAPKSHANVPALYTADQASKGALAYYQNCAMCHGPNLDGQPGGYSGPALKGADFADPSYDFHVKDIFNFVAKQMPAATPGSLSHEQDVQIMAFILQQNGYPPGTKELVYEEAEKSSVPIRYHGK